MEVESEFYREVRNLLNRQSRETITNTPDHVLARYLERCLAAYEAAVLERAAMGDDTSTQQLRIHRADD